MKGKNTITIIVLTLIFSHEGFAQNSDLKFNLVEGPDGKPFGHIRAICQDQQGYMWFAAEVGKCLYRYDGKRIIVFRHDDANPNSLGGHAIISVSADKNGLIWIGTDNGLDQYNPATGIFKHFRHSNKDPNSLAGALCFAPVIEDKRGRIWVGTDNGLDRLDEKKGTFIHYRNVPGNDKSLSSNTVWNIYEDRQGVIWVGTGFPWINDHPEDGGLNRLNADGSFTRYMHDPDDPHSLINNKVGAMYEDSQGTFWVGTGGDGLHTMDRKTGRFERHQYDPNKPGQLSRPPLKPNELNDKINFITEDSTGAIWIGTEYSGLNRYDPYTKKITHFENSNGFPARSGWHAISSRDGELWIATEEDKLFRVDPSYKAIHNIPVGSTVSRFMEDTDDNLWVCTLGDGLLKYDPQLHLLQQFKNIPNDSTSLPENFVISVYQLNANKFLVGMGSRIRVLDINSQKFSRIESYGHLNDTLGRGFPNILRDSQGIFWFCRWGSGLVSYNPKDNSCKHYHFDPDDSTSVASDLILNAIEDKSGAIWTGGDQGGGINRLNQETGKFKHYLRGKSFANLFESAKGSIWASGDDGLFQYNRPEDKFEGFFDPQSALNSINMNGIAEDDAENLWINSGSALIKVNPATKESFIYGSRFGIDSASLEIGGIFKNRKGQILAGNNKGFYIFYPNELDVKTNFTINITGLFINSSHTNYRKEKQQEGQVEEISELDLNYNQNNISIDFAAIDYRNPEAIKYFYLLDGYDREWQEVKEKKETSSYYFNLVPGTYTYRVKAFNDEGTIAEKVITITIRPPWWKTWWAYTLYGLITLALIIGLNRIQKQRIIQKERQKQQQFELAQAKEIEKAYHELRSTQAQLIQSEKMASLGELTAGIAHEIQNPLNFVNNFSDVNTELLDEADRAIDLDDMEETKKLMSAIRENEEKIKYHGNRADAIVKSMLQHSRTNTGQKEPTDINTLADEYLRLAYHGLRAKDKSFNAQIKTDFDDSVGKINVIPQDIGRVLLNLYNNAFYAVWEIKNKATESFEPTVSVSTKKQGNKIFIAVKDNGNGIPKNVLDKIFQPFFTTKPTGQGTGLGLSLSYDIVRAHGGNIRVESVEGEGTTISIELPA